MRELVLKMTPSTVILGLLKRGQALGLNIFIYRIPTKKIFSVSKTALLGLNEPGHLGI